MKINKEFFIERLDKLNLYLDIVSNGYDISFDDQDFADIYLESIAIAKFTYDTDLKCILENLSSSACNIHASFSDIDEEDIIQLRYSIEKAKDLLK